MLKRNHENFHNKTLMLFVCLNIIALLSVSVWLFVLVCVLDNANVRTRSFLQSADAYFDHRPVQARVLGTLAWSQLRSREPTENGQRRSGSRLTAGLLLAESVRLQQVLEVTVRLGGSTKVAQLVSTAGRE